MSLGVLMYKTYLYKTNKESLNNIILFPGRGQSAKSLLNFYIDRFRNDEVTLLAIEPNLEWYPAPNGVRDQKHSIEGIKKEIINLENFLEKIELEYKINRKEMTLAGFSAGAVIALQLGMHTNRPYKGIIVHNGAILDIENIPQSNNTPILVIHNQDDDCFKWEERYKPMKLALENNSFNAKFLESHYGNHSITKRDIENVEYWLATLES